MKKLIVGLVAVGAVMALRPVFKRRMVQKMREHCKEMAGKCKQMMATQSGDETSPVPEHWREMATQFKGHRQAGETNEPPEQEAPQFVGHSEAVGTL